MVRSWLKDAVFYEIYPQSFYDANGDGIGDIAGITQKLDYVKALGCNALWINPCFDSPFRDAGYDVRDYKKVAPRYGTNEDLYRLFEAAHEKGIHVLLDLVPGHTSEEHEWFTRSGAAKPNAYSNRYIWTNHWWQGGNGLPYVGGERERDGTYILNFFKCQPALNYGFLNPTEPWQLPMDHPDALATREAIKDVMRFWLGHGCDGFRVDMADSLVKRDDAQKSGTSAIWRDIRAMLDKEFPQAALVSEWSNPPLALRAGFDMDFCLNNWDTGYASLMRDYDQPVNNSYFKKDAPHRDIRRFLDVYERWYADTAALGYVSLISCNHDTTRPRFGLDVRELKLAYAFLFTMPGVPFMYYGDEIGMRYLNIPTREGGYTRTGSRTPMQWNAGRNLGFSTADAKDLYLPVDPAEAAPTVEAQTGDPDSLLNFVKALLKLRHDHEDLQADAPYAALSEGPGEPFVYRRGRLVLAVNPTGQTLRAAAPVNGLRPIFTLGEVSADGDALKMGPQSFGVMGEQPVSDQ